MKFKTLLIALFTLTASVVFAQQPCNAGFQYTVTTTPNGTVIAFTDSSFTVGTITNWSWTFNTGQTSNLQNPVITVNGGTTVYACLTITAVYQNQTCTDTYCDTAYTGFVPPVCDANFTYTVSPQGVQFFASGANNVSWTWSFGDGTAGTGASVFHAYGSGTYTVCLTVLDANGTTCNSCQSVTVPSSSGCQAYFTSAPVPGTTLVDFTDQSQGNPTSFLWTFGDGNTSTLQNPQHAYNSVGPFLVCLTITDSVANCSDTYCDSIFIGGSVLCDASFTFQTSPSTSVFIANAQNNVTWTWDFGDGSTGTGGPTATHTYANPGTYTVCLTVVTANGQICTTCQNVTITSGSGCSSNYALYPDTTQPHTYIAYNLATGAAPITYTWSWGDGTSSTGAYPSHTYNAPGLYTICLTITDGNGCTSTTCYPWQLLRLSSSVPVTINVVPGATGLVEPVSVGNVMIYPNPASDQVTTGFTLAEESSVSFSLMNMAGQEMLNFPAAIYTSGRHEVELNISSLPKGMYVIEIQSTRFTTHKKITIQ